jgi:uncharacterized protein
MVRIAVIGAAGRTGRLVVEQALERGHEVRALARRPDAIDVRGPALQIVSVDVRNAGALANSDGAMINAASAAMPRARRTLGP